MNIFRARSAIAGALALLAAGAAPIRKDVEKADLVPLPTAAEVRSLSVHPTVFRLRGGDSSQQLIVAAALKDRTQDLTENVEYQVADPKVVKVTTTGRVLPLANGTTKITAVYGDKRVETTVTTESCDVDLPINFANQVVPIFAKAGCNSGGCHGKISGQNGFRLSLLGFEPELDYATLVKENRGRRVSPSAPDRSLLLLKATGIIPHGGGKRIDIGSDEYKIIRRWIASGTPVGSDTDPTVTHISVYPEHRVTTRQNKAQFAVYAHYSDGSVEDVTRRAQYDSNDQEIAVVEPTGLARTLALSGEAAVMARYQGKVTVFRITVPLGVPVPDWKFEPKTLVDVHTARKWKELGIAPSELCTDEQFVRRAYLDITGTLPTPAQVKEFLADTAADKRDKLVDKLVDLPEYGYLFANKWADILRVKRGNQQNQNRAFGTFVFHDWIRESLTMDRPYDEFVRSIVGAVGDESKCPPTVWYKDIQTPDQFVDNLSQVFLGTRMQCAQCHHHPYEKWTQDDYWGLAAYSARLARKNIQVPGLTGQQQQQQRLVLFTRATGSVVNKRTNKTAAIKPLDGPSLDVDADVDPRHKLVDWMVDPKNPFFARAVANRYWAHFFARGLVDPLDDMRVTNPPSNPELLDALAKDFVANKYSLKHLVKTICKSRTYQLSSEPTDFNRHDKQNYARYYPRRMSAEVIFDAVAQVTNSPTKFNGLPDDTHAPRRALMLPDESFQSYFLDVFGRPQRISPCECERVTEANLAQVLHMLTSEEVQQKVARAGGRADLLAKDQRPDTEKVEELFLWCVGQKPSAAKMEKALALIERNQANKKVAYEDILWTLLNTKGFQFNQ
jgi:hypothetical protein